MDWTTQPELRDIYRSELRERAEALVDGARRLAQSPLGPRDIEDLVRHAHTLKGSSRVMGFGVPGDAAEALERAWRDPEMGMAPLLEQVGRLLSEHAVGALDSPSPDLLSSSDELRLLVGLPQGSSPVAIHVPEEHSFQLGGLLRAWDPGSSPGRVGIDSQRFYRLVNAIVELRLDAEALAAVLPDVRLAVATTGSRDLAEFSQTWEHAVDRIEEQAGEMMAMALSLATTSLDEMLDSSERFVGYLARRGGKQVVVENVGLDEQVDRQILDLIREPIRHLLVNAVDHGIESPDERIAAGKEPTGTVWLRAGTIGGQLEIRVEDDGRGVDWAAVGELAGLDADAPQTLLQQSLFERGFSTREEQDDFSGDGTGLATVTEAVATAHGSMTLRDREGGGTEVRLVLPSAVSMLDVLIVTVGRHVWALPSTAVVANMAIGDADVRLGDSRMELWYEGAALPISSLARAIGLPEAEVDNEVVVLSTVGGRVAVTVPEVVGRRGVAMRTVGPVLGGSPQITGAALLGGGNVAVVLEPARIAELVRRLPVERLSRGRILVVDDSKGVRQLVAAILAGHGFEPVVAASVEEALRLMEVDTYQALVVDYAMPGSDGVALVETVRAGNVGLPIVMVSGVANEMDRDRARAAGIDAYLDKSELRHGALISTLETVLGMRSGRS